MYNSKYNGEQVESILDSVGGKYTKPPTGIPKSDLASDVIPDIPDISELAPLASPNFSGTPTAPTPTNSTNNTRIATTAFVQSLIATVNSSISALNNYIKGTFTKISGTQTTGKWYSGSTISTNANLSYWSFSVTASNVYAFKGAYKPSSAWNYSVVVYYNGSTYLGSEYNEAGPLLYGITLLHLPANCNRVYINTNTSGSSVELYRINF